jgi:hypothetical protein
VRLHALVLGDTVATDGEEVDAGLALLAELSTLGASPAEGWAGLLSVLMRDPDFLLY